jgi:hypothetical protein
MPTLEINPDYVHMLTLKVRALMGKEAPTFPDEGSNANDDPLAGLQDSPDDQTRREIVKEISGLSEGEQAELVALMWLGRGDGEPEEWDALVQQAKERREVPTATYLLDHPLLAEHWLDAFEMLGLDPLESGVEEI